MEDTRSCIGCRYLIWKPDPTYMSEAYCQRFGRVVGDDWCADTAPRPIEKTCYMKG